MYSTKSGAASKANGFDKNTAHAMRVTKRPRYMGLRVNR